MKEGISYENFTHSDPHPSPRVLVAPLDWGLGHATRCIPIIHQLLAQGAHPVLAAEGKSAEVLKLEFPLLPLLPLPGYGVKFRNSTFSLLSQVPRIYSAIQKENAWLEELLQR
jgi:hypothetical protein